jgi:hypothetical protein
MSGRTGGLRNPSGSETDASCRPTLHGVAASAAAIAHARFRIDFQFHPVLSSGLEAVVVVQF